MYYSYNKDMIIKVNLSCHWVTATRSRHNACLLFVEQTRPPRLMKQSVWSQDLIMIRANQYDQLGTIHLLHRPIVVSEIDKSPRRERHGVCQRQVLLYIDYNVDLDIETNDVNYR
jgi:hypothetical protein